MSLSDNEKRDVIKYLEAGKSLPEKYRFLLFDDDREVEFVWNGKTDEVTNIVLPSSSTTKIVKARMTCRALRDRSLRIVYSYFEQEQRIEFIELYYKGDKKNEDRNRIKEYLNNYEN